MCYIKKKSHFILNIHAFLNILSMYFILWFRLFGFNEKKILKKCLEYSLLFVQDDIWAVLPGCT